MATDDGQARPEPIRVRPSWATPEPARSQVLVREVAGARGWRHPAHYEIAYYPEGLLTSPAWVRPTSSLGKIPGRTHTTDLYDLRVLVEQARAEGDDRWTAWPVWYPAVARERDLRRLREPERRTMDDYRARQHIDPVAAGKVPIRVRHLGRRDRVVDGVVHELTSPDRTRCGLPAAGLTSLHETFDGADPQACPRCRLA